MSTPPDPRPPLGRRLLQGPQALLRAIFVDQIKLPRPREKLLAGPEPGATAQRTPSAPTPAPPSGPQAVMLRELAALLGSGPTHRSVFKHLAALEQLLSRSDGDFIERLSPHVLRQMDRQLDGLIVPPATPGLARLQLHLRHALEMQEEHQRQSSRTQPVSSFFVDHKLEVSEGTATDFAELMGSQSKPGDPPRT